MYAAPQSPKRTAVNELVRVGDAPTAVTDGTFLPKGDRIALLTALGTIEILDADDYQKVGTATAPAQRQPESITVSLTEKSLLVGSEGEESVVYAVPIPEGSSTAAPTATPSDSDSGDESDPAGEQEADTTTGQAGHGPCWPSAWPGWSPSPPAAWSSWCGSPKEEGEGKREGGGEKGEGGGGREGEEERGFLKK